jgi:hypothetical protein
MRRDILAIDRRVVELERRIKSLPSRFPSSATATDRSYLVTVLGGNVSAVQPGPTDIRCIKKATAKPTPLAAYDPSPATPAGLPWPDGIGYGDMIVGTSLQRVLLAYYDGAPTTLTGTVIARTPVAVREKVLLTDGGDPAISVEAWVVRHV